MINQKGNYNDVGSYDAVVIGSAIRMGKWLPETVSFLKKHRETLAGLPVAFFVVCLTMKEDTPEKRKEVLAYLDPVLKENSQIIPIDIGLFAGAVDFKKLS